MDTQGSDRLRRLVREHRREILEAAARHGARDVRLFGSAARGEADESSDVDFLVAFDDNVGLFDHVGLILELESLLGVRVDVANQVALQPAIREQVLREAVPV